MVDFEIIIQKLNKKDTEFNKSINTLNGELNLLSSQINKCQEKIVELDKLKINTIKATELLHLVQQASRDTVVSAFENTVTYALRSIYQNDGYSFKLDFSQRGHLGELWFQIKSPTSNGYLDLKDCGCGGELDVTSIALRFILLHLIQPKINGPILMDESSKMISSNLRQNEYNFYCQMAERFGRQLLIVTHSNELKDLAVNKIELGGI